MYESVGSFSTFSIMCGSIRLRTSCPEHAHNDSLNSSSVVPTKITKRRLDVSRHLLKFLQSGGFHLLFLKCPSKRFEGRSFCNAVLWRESGVSMGSFSSSAGLRSRVYLAMSNRILTLTSISGCAGGFFASDDPDFLSAILLKQVEE